MQGASTPYNERANWVALQFGIQQQTLLMKGKQAQIIQKLKFYIISTAANVNGKAYMSQNFNCIFAAVN